MKYRLLKDIWVTEDWHVVCMNPSIVYHEETNMAEKYFKPLKVIAVTAGKGGVGKSNISINLALSLAQKKKKVLLLDADLGLANIDIMLNLSPTYNLSHVLQGTADLSQIIVDGPLNLRIIPAASGTDFMTQLTPTQHAGIINAFNELTEEFDYMIIDTAAGISDLVLSFASSAQEVVVIICDEPTSLTDAYALIKVMRKRFEWCQFHIICNMVRNSSAGRELFKRIYRVAEHFLDVQLDYLGAIPYDACISEAVKKQQAVLIAYPDCAAAKAFKQLSNTIEEWPFKYGLGGNTSFFLERLVAGSDKKPNLDLF